MFKYAYTKYRSINQLDKQLYIERNATLYIH